MGRRCRHPFVNGPLLGRPVCPFNRGEAVTSGLRAYDPKGGLFSAGVCSSVKYQWNPNRATLAYAQVDRLVGDAKECPITERGSETQLTVGVGFTYTTQWDRLKLWER